MGKMSQKIWYSIMPRQSKHVEISTVAEISAQNILGIITPWVGVFDLVIIFSISLKEISESAVDLGQKISLTEVNFIKTDPTPRWECAPSERNLGEFQTVIVSNLNVFLFGFWVKLYADISLYQSIDAGEWFQHNVRVQIDSFLFDWHDESFRELTLCIWTYLLNNWSEYVMYGS